MLVDFATKGALRTQRMMVADSPLFSLSQTCQVTVSMGDDNADDNDKDRNSTESSLELGHVIQYEKFPRSGGPAKDMTVVLTLR